MPVLKEILVTSIQALKSRKEKSGKITKCKSCICWTRAAYLMGRKGTLRRTGKHNY